MKFLCHLCLLLLLGLSSCSYLGEKFGHYMPKKKSSADKRTGEVKLIGVVEMVNPEQHYVLINCERRVDIPAGTEIITQGVNGTDAKLKVTPERKGNYITADIMQGMPQLRDLVLYQVKSEEPAQPIMTAATGGMTTATGPMPAATGFVAPLRPVMQADVIPPLNAPYQPMAPVQPSFVPPPAAPLPLRQAPLAPAQPPADEPAADLSKLPPVIR